MHYVYKLLIRVIGPFLWGEGRTFPMKIDQGVKNFVALGTP